MRILLAGVADDSNVGFELQMAVRAAGHEALSVCERQHPFRYPQQSLVKDKVQNLCQMVETADVIDFYNSLWVELPSRVAGKSIVVQHGGGYYRKFPERMNEHWNKIASVTVTRTGDLYGLGAENEVFLVTPVDTETLAATRLPDAPKLIVGHYPSRTTAKGSEIIAEVMYEYRDLVEFRTRDKPVPWERHIEEIKECHVVIETLKPELGGRVFGEPGVSSREIASLGRIVITNSLTVPLYNWFYGYFAPLVANTPEELADCLDRVLAMTRKQLQTLASEMRRWVVKHHSREATGKQLIKRVYEPAIKAGARRFSPSLIGAVMDSPSQAFYEGELMRVCGEQGHSMEARNRYPGWSEFACVKCHRKAGAAEFPPSGASYVNGDAVDHPCS